MKHRRFLGTCFWKIVKPEVRKISTKMSIDNKAMPAQQQAMATKRRLEDLVGVAAGATGKEALKLLARVPEHRKQYMLATEAAHECVKLGRSESVERYLGELRSLFVATVNTKAKLSERATLLAGGVMAEKRLAANTHCISPEDKLYALMENWSLEKQSPATLSESVFLAQELIRESCDKKDLSEQEEDDSTADAETDVAAEEEYQSLVSENSVDEFPLGMLLEIAAKHYNKEYKGLLSESQMKFMTNYVSMDSTEFVSSVIKPLEEQLSKAIKSLSTDSAFSEQFKTVSSLLEQFKADRTIVSSCNHKQHVAAMDFYLSLVDLTEKINLQEEDRSSSTKPSSPSKATQ